jgi:hypothetical protein
VRRSAEVDDPGTIISTSPGHHAVPAAFLVDRYSNMAVCEDEDLFSILRSGLNRSP